MARGFKSGGRQPGSLNKRTQALRERAREALTAIENGDELLPLPFLLEVMHKRRKATKQQIEIAIACLSYCHPKLAALDIDTTTHADMTPAGQATDEQLWAIVMEGRTEGGKLNAPQAGTDARLRPLAEIIDDPKLVAERVELLRAEIREIEANAVAASRKPAFVPAKHVKDTLASQRSF